VRARGNGGKLEAAFGVGPRCESAIEEDDDIVGADLSGVQSAVLVRIEE
jgi:hypothetical protein